MPLGSPTPAPDRDHRAPAFSEVYREHVRYVWNTLRRLGVRDRDLEDLAHDVFVVAYRKRADYKPELPMRRWLFGIAFRVAAGDRRKARHAREIACDDVDVAAGGDDLDTAAARRALCLRALAALPLEQRAVLVMHDLDGYSAPEIAIALEVPLNTVYSRLRLGRAKFTLAARQLTGNGECA